MIGTVLYCLLVAVYWCRTVLVDWWIFETPQFSTAPRYLAIWNWLLFKVICSFIYMYRHHHHHPFNVLSGIVHVSVGKDVPNYFTWNEKLQVNVKPNIRLNKTASLDFNWSIDLCLYFTAGCLSCHKQERLFWHNIIAFVALMGC